MAFEYPSSSLQTLEFYIKRYKWVTLDIIQRFQNAKEHNDGSRSRMHAKRENRVGGLVSTCAPAPVAKRARTVPQASRRHQVHSRRAGQSADRAGTRARARGRRNARVPASPPISPASNCAPFLRKEEGDTGDGGVPGTRA